MVSDGSVTDIKGLKGKQVAYEEGTTSDILLNYALAQNGMTIADIEKVPMPASDAGAALIAGKVPVAVTYEPYLTLAMQQNPKVKMIYSGRRESGPHLRRLRGARGVPGREARRRSSPCSRPGTRRSPTTAPTPPAAGRSSPRRSAPSPRSSPPPSTASSIIRSPRTRRELCRRFHHQGHPGGARPPRRKAGILQKDVDLTKRDRRPVRGCRDASKRAGGGAGRPLRARRPHRGDARFSASPPRSSSVLAARSGGRSPRPASCCRCSCRRPARCCAGSASSAPAGQLAADIGDQHLPHHASAS